MNRNAQGEWRNMGGLDRDEGAPRLRTDGRRRSHRWRQVKVGGLVFGAGLLLSACTPATLTPAERLNAGLSASSAGNYTAARGDYQDVLRSDPTDKYGLNNIAWYDLGVLDQTLGNASAAISEYREAILLDPKYVSAFYNLGVLESTIHHEAAAIAYYRDALALSPADPNIQWNLGLLLYEHGYIAQGRQYLRSAIRTNSGFLQKLPKNVHL